MSSQECLDVSAEAETPQLSAEELEKLLEQAVEKAEKLAESQLEMAHLFLSKGKADIARRRLQEILDRYPDCTAAEPARQLLAELPA